MKRSLKRGSKRRLADRLRATKCRARHLNVPWDIDSVNRYRSFARAMVCGRAVHEDQRRPAAGLRYRHAVGDYESRGGIVRRTRDARTPTAAERSGMGRSSCSRCIERSLWRRYAGARGATEHLKHIARLKEPRLAGARGCSARRVWMKPSTVERIRSTRLCVVAIPALETAAQHPDTRRRPASAGFPRVPAWQPRHNARALTSGAGR